MSEAEWQAGGAFKRVRHHDDAFEKVWPHQGAQRGSHGAEVMPDDAFDFPVAQCVYQNNDIADQVGQGELRHVCLGEGGVVPSRGPPISTLVKTYNVMTRISQRRHDFSP
jgi:hypothetical protein